MTFIEELSGTNNLDVIRSYWMKTHKYLISLSLEERKKERSRLHNEFLSRFKNQIPAIKDLLEETARSLLGSTLVSPNKKRYKVSMLEIYADGIWDEGGDYIKEIFRNEETNAISKMMQGPMLYYFGGRIDIKVFANFLPFSFLIRKLEGHGIEQYFDEKYGSAYPQKKENNRCVYKKYCQIFGIQNYFKGLSSYKNLIFEESPDFKLLLYGNHDFSLEGPFNSISENQIRKEKRVCNRSFRGLSSFDKDRHWNFSIL